MFLQHSWGGGVALLLSSIERGAQRFVSQAIHRANGGNLEWLDTSVFAVSFSNFCRSCDVFCVTRDIN